MSLTIIPRIVSLAVAATLTSALGIGCAEQPLDDADATVEQALTCQGQSCDGVIPANTSCKFDMIDTGIGTAITDATGRAIGGIGLFRSPSCQTVWATVAFYVSGGPRNFRVCTVRERATQNDPSCIDYSGSFGNDAPMKYANSGKTVFGKVTVDGKTTRTVGYTVP